MNKELQDKAWSVLPKEFKEEVKKLYREFTFTREGYYVELFGLHNLTSDAEGEEMLTIPRRKVQEMYARNDAICNASERPKDYLEPRYEYADAITLTLADLFGSKCLPDDADSSEKKENRCEKCGAPNSSICAHMNCQDYPSQSEPKPAEPEEESRNLSQETANCDKHFDNILKGSFRNERRLNIAAMAMQGIVSNPTAMNGPKLIDGDEEILAKWSLKFADALIAECELTEKLKGE